MIRTTILFGTLSLLLFGLAACYVNLDKHVDREVRVRIIEHLPVSVFNEGNSTFNEYLNDAGYKEHFLSGLKGDLQATTNIVIDDVNPEYEIQFTQLSITESTRIDTVKNESSPDNGKTFELTTMYLISKGTLIQLSSGTTYSWYADKQKRESFTSLRSPEEILNGTNKEKNRYREQSFVSSTAADLTRKVGRRSGVVIVKELKRSLK